MVEMCYYWALYFEEKAAPQDDNLFYKKKLPSLHVVPALKFPDVDESHFSVHSKLTNC